MAMIQNTNEVHFTGMTRVQLEGNKIIASQNGESQVTIAANTRSLTELADKISESSARKEVVTDQEMLDRAVMEKYKGHCKDHILETEKFVEFYLSANRLNYNLYEMAHHLSMRPGYIKTKMDVAKYFCRDLGFKLPELRNVSEDRSSVIKSKLSSLNWAG